MRFTCTICHRFAHPILQGVLKHVGSVHSHEHDFRVICGTGGCSKSYTNYRSFQKHIHQIHITSLQENDKIPVDDSLLVPEGNEGDDHDDPHRTSIIANKRSLKCNAALLLLKTKWDESQLTLNIVFDLSNFIQVQMDELQES